MVNGNISFKRSVIGYSVFGNGPQPVICFHGYGENAHTFRILEPAGNDHTFYAIDLPYHGQTDWKEGDLHPHELKEILFQILPPQHQNSIILMGYSLGGRIILSLYELMHPVVKRMVLIAPDGLKMNPWYWIATQTKAGNGLFHYTMEKPKWFFVMLKGLNSLKLVNSSIFKFVNQQIGDKQVRVDLYHRWTALRKFRPNLKRIKKMVMAENTKVRIIYGKHDKIILPSRGILFCKGIEDNCDLVILDSGHQLLTKKHASEIADKLTR